MTASKDWELGNVRKCLAAGYDIVMLVTCEERQLKSLSAFVTGQLEEKQRERVRYSRLKESWPFLDELEASTEVKEEIVRGYKVKVTRAALEPDEMKKRRDAIAKVLARSMQNARKT